MATMPPRIEALKESITSILPQCDLIYIYLNDFEDVPSFLIHPKIICYRSQDEMGDMGDVGKFYNCEQWVEGYHFTVDDKLIYPSDYTRRMIATVDLYDMKAVISCHGRLLKPNCRSYYFDASQFFGCLRRLSIDTFAHELGTGVMCFHSSTFKPDLSMFPTINMTDIWVSLALQKKEIPILIRAHQRAWIGISTRHDDNYSIHAMCNQKDEYQTQVVNSFKWKVNKCPSLL